MGTRIPNPRSNNGVIALVLMGTLAGLVGLYLAVFALWFAFGAPGVAILAIILVMPVLAWLWFKTSSAERARRDREDAEDDWADFLDEFPPETHEAITRLHTPSHAEQLWPAMGLGRAAVVTPTKFTPALVPQIVPGSFERTAIGVSLHMTTLDGQALRAYTAKSPEIAAALNVPAVRVRPGPNSRTIVLDLKVHDPLGGMFVSNLFDDATRARIKAAALAGGTDAEVSAAIQAACQGARLMVEPGALSCLDDIQLMISEFGQVNVVNLAKGVHGAIQGATRSGKSITINTLLAWASLMRDVRVVVIDPNTATCAPWWRTAWKVYNGTDPKAAAAILEEVKAELLERTDVFWAERSDKITSFSPERPLYLIVIDEVAEFSGSKEFQATLKDVGAQVAKFGGRLYLAGQKLSGEELSTATRANLFDRICHRVDAGEAFKHLYDDATELAASGISPVSKTLPKGVGVITLATDPEPHYARAVFLPTEACWVISDAIVAKYGEVRPLPSRLAATKTKPTSKKLANTGTDGPATPPPPPPTKRKPGQDEVEFPNFGEVTTTQNVFPIDRSRRTDPPADQTSPAADPIADTE